MPTYEYECSQCGHRFELFQQITDSPKRKCPKCGHLKVRRLISAGSAVLFRGSGFYETDYRSDEYKKQAKAEKAQASGDKGKADKGKEKKSSGDTSK